MSINSPGGASSSQWASALPGPEEVRGPFSYQVLGEGDLLLKALGEKYPKKMRKRSGSGEAEEVIALGHPWAQSVPPWIIWVLLLGWGSVGGGAGFWVLNVRSFHLYVLFMQVYKHGGNNNMQMGHSALDNIPF